MLLSQAATRKRGTVRLMKLPCGVAAAASSSTSLVWCRGLPAAGRRTYGASSERGGPSLLRRSARRGNEGVVVLDDGDGAVVHYERDFLTPPQSRSMMSVLMPTDFSDDEGVGNVAPIALDGQEEGGEAVQRTTTTSTVLWERDALQPYSLRAREGARNRAERQRASGAHNASKDGGEENDGKPVEGHLVTRRRVCAFGDVGVRYNYTNITREGLGWPSFLEELKRMVEARAEQPFNFVFCNFYADEHDYIGWHQDKEDAIVKRSTIATVSLGATRRFCLRHDKTKHISQIMLEDGSLMLMQGSVQERYRHSLPRALTPCGPRISLTFRLLHAAPPSGIPQLNK